MKHLFIIRHAKAQKDQPGQKDFDRILTERGIEDAEKAGSLLKNHLLGRCFLLASPAARTAMTATIIGEKSGLKKSAIHFHPEIYQAYPDTLSGLLRNTPNDVDCIILVGHNPAVHLLTEAYTGRAIDRFPTCSVAGLSFDTDKWSAIDYQSGNLFMFEFPLKNS
jgi:phosphohistidine phosphatase